MKRKFSYYSIVIIAIFFIVKSNEVDGIREHFIQNQKNATHLGIIKSKYIDRGNHAYKTLQIENIDSIYNTTWTTDKSGFFDFVLEGDSISKKSGTSKMDVYREGALTRSFYIDF